MSGSGSHELPKLNGYELVPYADSLHQEVYQFLVMEALLLDQRRYGEWLALMAEDIVYRMPVRVTTASGDATTTLSDMDHFRENHFTLSKRVERLYTEYAWTEDPASRVRHFVTNVLTYRLQSGTGPLVARSSLLMFRSRADYREPELMSAERTDHLTRGESGWMIARRDILVDESVLRTQNLAIFL
jgi:3-phenylpropionate/cinnamic acid dioxygenase small subunit